MLSKQADREERKTKPTWSQIWQEMWSATRETSAGISAATGQVIDTIIPHKSHYPNYLHDAFLIFQPSPHLTRRITEISPRHLQTTALQPAPPAQASRVFSLLVDTSTLAQVSPGIPSEATALPNAAVQYSGALPPIPCFNSLPFQPGFSVGLLSSSLLLTWG